jgi:hypothetical protein
MKKTYHVTINYQREIHDHYTKAVSPAQALLQVVGKICLQLRMRTVKNLHNYLLATPNSYTVTLIKEKETGPDANRTTEE